MRIGNTWTISCLVKICRRDTKLSCVHTRQFLLRSGLSIFLKANFFDKDYQLTPAMVLMQANLSHVTVNPHKKFQSIASKASSSRKNCRQALSQPKQSRRKAFTLYHLPIVEMAMVVSQKDIDYSIKPEAAIPAVDTSTWPLLLKNYDKREQRNSSDLKALSYIY